MEIECICIDGKNRPPEVFPQKWINEGTKYHIVHVSYHPNQGIQGVYLKEVNLKHCEPYDTYRLNRFAIREEDLPKLIELMKACTELNEINIKQLIEESQLEIINQ
jgi:hypothetical protein